MVPSTLCCRYCHFCIGVQLQQTISLVSFKGKAEQIPTLIFTCWCNSSSMTCIAFDCVHAFMTYAIAMTAASSTRQRAHTAGSEYIATGLQPRAPAYSIIPVQNFLLPPLMSLKLQSKTVRSDTKTRQFSMKVTGTRQTKLIDLEVSCQKHIWIACYGTCMLD